MVSLKCSLSLLCETSESASAGAARPDTATRTARAESEVLVISIVLSCELPFRQMLSAGCSHKPSSARISLLKSVTWRAVFLHGNNTPPAEPGDGQAPWWPAGMPVPQTLPGVGAATFVSARGNRSRAAGAGACTRSPTALYRRQHHWLSWRVGASRPRSFLLPQVRIGSR